MSAFTPYVRNLGREITADAHAFLAAAIDRGDIYLAVDGAEVVGVAATERRDGGIYIDRLGVAPARQGTGLGSWLLVRIEEVARSIGARSLSLETARARAKNGALPALGAISVSIAIPSGGVSLTWGLSLRRCSGRLISDHRSVFWALTCFERASFEHRGQAYT